MPVCVGVAMTLWNNEVMHRSKKKLMNVLKSVGR